MERYVGARTWGARLKGLVNPVSSGEREL